MEEEREAHFAESSIHSFIIHHSSFMNTLERSSFSFRRQGSSGRIWDNQFQAFEPKADVPQAAATATRKRQEVKFQEMETQTPRSWSGNSTPPPPNSQDKGQRCAFSAVFWRCIGTRTP
ncbi:hypothetical protein PVL29_019206 [Vitis rotundifolia]|uniref:Uncharacterized protein n=1 Tax=Vitis rotundifolia TaxID=103349 RepID=A0AA38Z781_VITRO|nr:hypothetical protein PVL29_019206 [Vitis rotundifolia]